ncbi:MAG: M50 family metallopeptidase [archaeon]
MKGFEIVASYFFGIQPSPGVALIIPGVSIPGSPIEVPLIAWFGFVLAIVVHELAHGILAEKAKVSVKSFGLLTLGLIPLGAYTEINEKKLKGKSNFDKIKFFSAGSSINIFISFILAVVLLVSQTQIDIQKEYLNNIRSAVISEVYPGSPAELAGLKKGDVIYSPQNLFNVVGQRNISFYLNTSRGLLNLTTDEKGYIGVKLSEFTFYRPFGLDFWVKKSYIEIVYWTFFLNLMLGVFNFAPFAILDGLKMFPIILGTLFGRKLNKKAILKISKGLTYLVLFFLILNFLPYFIRI